MFNVTSEVMTRSRQPRKQQGAKNGQQPIDSSFAPVVNAFSRRRDVTYGKLMSSYGLKVNGKIFAMFGRGKFVAKLPKSRVEELIAQGRGERFDPGHGRLMKEWIAIDSEPGRWTDLAEEAYEFVKKTVSTT